MTDKTFQCCLSRISPTDGAATNPILFDGSWRRQGNKVILKMKRDGYRDHLIEFSSDDALRLPAESIPNWRRHFGDFCVPAWFEEYCCDLSWGQDAVPIFMFGGKYAILVDAADPEHSEFCTERQSGERKRYSIHRQGESGDRPLSDSIMETDSLERVTTFLLSTVDGEASARPDPASIVDEVENLLQGGPPALYRAVDDDFLAGIDEEMLISEYEVNGPWGVITRWCRHMHWTWKQCEIAGKARELALEQAARNPVSTSHVNVLHAYARCMVKWLLEVKVCGLQVVEDGHSGCIHAELANYSVYFTPLWEGNLEFCLTVDDDRGAIIENVVEPFTWTGDLERDCRNWKFTVEKHLGNFMGAWGLLGETS